MTDTQRVMDMQNAIGGPESRYQARKCLGSGGMGDVYLAEDTELHRLVAVKTVRDALREDEEIRRRIARECLLHAKVGPHPHIVTLFDKLEEEGRLQLIMEYVDGESLHAHLARLADREAVLPLHESVRIIAQCLDALSRIHANGIVHRDIKPANIMLSRDEQGAVIAKLMDFGIARPALESQTSTPITRSGSGGPGTPLYMAPEQIDSRTYGEVSAATDVYAMGVLLYQLLSGKPPFDGTLTEVLNGHLNRPVPPLEVDALGPDSEFLSEAIERALAKKPSERFPSAKAFQDELMRLSVLQGPATAVGMEATQRLAFTAPTMTAQPKDAETGKGGTLLPDGADPDGSSQSLMVKLSAGAAVVVMAAVLGVGVWWLGAAPGASPVEPPPAASSSPAQAEATPGEPREQPDSVVVPSNDPVAPPETSEIPQVLAIPEPESPDADGVGPDAPERAGVAVSPVIPLQDGPGSVPGTAPGSPEPEEPALATANGVPVAPGAPNTPDTTAPATPDRSVAEVPEDGAAMAAFLDETPADTKQSDDAAQAKAQEKTLEEAPEKASDGVPKLALDEPKGKPVAAEKTTPPVASADGRTYVVQSGDSVAKIAAEFDVKTADIARWNQLERPESIDVGQVLYLHEPAGLSKAKHEAKEPAPARAKKPAKGKAKTAEALYEEPEHPAEEEEAKPKRSLRGVLRRIRR